MTQIPQSLSFSLYDVCTDAERDLHSLLWIAGLSVCCSAVAVVISPRMAQLIFSRNLLPLSRVLCDPAQDLLTSCSHSDRGTRGTRSAQPRTRWPWPRPGTAPSCHPMMQKNVHKIRAQIIIPSLTVISVLKLAMLPRLQSHVAIPVEANPRRRDAERRGKVFIMMTM